MANPVRSLLQRFGLWTDQETDQIQEKVQQDIALSVGNSPNVLNSAIRSRSKVLGRALSYEFQGYDLQSRPGTNTFSPPIYDLAEIARATDVEPYIDQSIRKHREMILKEGYTVHGEDDEMVSYIKKRLFDMALVTGIPTETWIRECVTNLVKYHNMFLVVRRDVTRSRGSRIKMHGKILDPIAGAFILDPTSMSVKVDRFGTPKKWQQQLESGGVGAQNTKRFNPEDIIHATLDKNTGFTFGTPYILPVLDDVRALRRLEELAVMLASKEVFPLYHYKIGTDQLPAMQLEDGGDEVDLVRAEVANMPLQGNLITSHRHEVNLVSRDGSALDLNPFLQYFEARVMGGLRLSALDLGRGGTANRACYSGDTETLTDKGWKNHWEIDVENDLIGTFNPETKQLELHKPASKYVYAYSGKMYYFKSRMTDILVTPDHDMWVNYPEAESHPPGLKWHKAHAEDIQSQTPFQFQVQTEWKDQIKPLAPLILGDYPEIPADTWLKFLAYFIKYGKVTPSKNEMKFIIRSRAVSETLQAFVKALPFEFRIYDNNDYTKFAVNDIELVRHLSMVCSCRTYPKRIPSYVMQADTESLRLFLGEIAPPEPMQGTTIYYARTYTLAGQVQEMAFKLGYQAKVLEDAKKPRVLITEGNQTDTLTDENIEVVDYDGDVYCFNVPNHLFVTRRNGKIAIQGNTAANINKNVQDAAKDYQQAFTTALSHGLFLPLLLEGGYNVTEENMVFLTFPDIDREEMRAQQNHGLQLLLANATDRDEYRKDFLGKPPLTEEQEKNTPRQLDAEVDEKLAQVAAAVAPNPEAGSSSLSSTSKNSTVTSSKSVSNRGQPRNQFGSKTKSRNKANDYRTILRNEFDTFRGRIVTLIESDQDELDIETLDEQLRAAFGEFVTNCMTRGKKYLKEEVEDGVVTVLDQSGDLEEDIQIGRRALDKFFSNCVEKSFWKVVSPFRDSICGLIIPDQEGNSPRYKAYGSLSSLWISIERLAEGQTRSSYRFGFAKASRILGYTSMEMQNPESGDRKTIELNKGPIVYRNLIPDLTDDYTELTLGSKLIQDNSDDGDTLV